MKNRYIIFLPIVSVLGFCIAFHAALRKAAEPKPTERPTCELKQFNFKGKRSDAIYFNAGSHILFTSSFEGHDIVHHAVQCNCHWYLQIDHSLTP